MALQMVIDPGELGSMEYSIRIAERVLWMRHALLGKVDDDMHEEDAWRMELRSGDNTPVLLHLRWDAQERKHWMGTGEDFIWVSHASELHNALLHLMRDEPSLAQAWDALERMCSGLNMLLPMGVWRELTGEASSCDLGCHAKREERVREELQRLAQSRYIGFRDIMLPCPMAQPHEELPLYIRRPCHRANVRLVSCVRFAS